jgi:hypothetical protein
VGEGQVPTQPSPSERDWRRLGDRALEDLLVERWLYRGLLLGVVFLAAVVVTLLGAWGLAGRREQVAAGILVVLAIAVGAVALAMRQRDLKIHRELRRRRRSRPPSDA